MFAALALAAVVFPAPGTYLYAVKTTSGASVASNVTIARRTDGLVTHEVLRTTTPLVTTDQRFDAGLREVWYAGANSGGPQVTISIAPSSAQLQVAGNTTTIPLDHPACVLVLDNILTSSVMLPSVVRATGATTCTFVAPNAATTVKATIGTTAPSTRPADAAPSDIAMTLQIAGITETLWYDARTLIPDDIDFGNGASATLSATTASTEIPAAAPTATPLVSRFRARDVTFASRDGSTIAGTISYPDGASSQVPGFVLVAGSGTSDRNEAIGPYHLLFDLAEGLNANGYAVLRYDKRFAGESISKTAGSAVTRQSYVDDILAAVTALRADPHIDPKRIYLLGHSEGGELIMGAQLQGANARGLVLLAPLSTPFTTALEDQERRGMISQKGVDELIAANATYFASWKTIEPSKEVANIDVPMLVIRGSNDVNVTADELSQLTAAAVEAHRTMQVVVLTGDNHLYTSADTNFDPRVIQTIAAWLATNP
ncbi:MAG TPA: alpha/beta fold hydrolase [Verrucomicrobiae bacterium]|nr:alpha/beta fold hydrolase [Verrucomicrobiae bacterium]